MKISIAIPTWESYGRGAEFLDDLLRTIEIQTFKDFEVCISDHSKENEVLNKVKEFEDKINIQYCKNEQLRVVSQIYEHVKPQRNCTCRNLVTLH